MDIDSIPFGVDFQDHFTHALSGTDVLLLIIGGKWLGSSKGKSRRIDDPRDFVRIEVEKAIELNVPILPVLVDSAEMPSPTRLPEALRKISYLNAVDVDSGRDFDHHIERLFRAIDALSPASARPDRKLSAPTAPIVRHRVYYPFVASVALAIVFAAAAVWWFWPRSPTNVLKSTVAPDRADASVACEEEKNLRSLGTQFATYINFTNETSQDVRLYWINHQGGRQLYGNLARRETRSFQTYITHPWLVADLQDKCLGIYMPAASKLDVTIR